MATELLGRWLATFSFSGASKLGGTIKSSVPLGAALIQIANTGSA
jgi:hypothetical protein